MNIAKQIINRHPFERKSEVFNENPVYEAKISNKIVKLVTLNQESIYAQNLTEFFENPQLVIFISRHSSESGTPTLSVHTPGNFGNAEFGGLPKNVSVSPANAMRDALLSMARLKGEVQLDYDVCYECTHHGPSLDVPTMFAELGSSPKQWSDLKAAEVVADAVINAVAKFGVSNAKAVLGIGGPHYNAKFTRIASESEIAFGHIIPKYAFPCVDAEILKQCVRKTFEKVEYAVLDWKGIRGEDKPKVVKMLDETGLRYEKV